MPKPSDEDRNGHVVEGDLSRGEGRLEVSPRAAIAVDPAKEMLDGLAARMHAKQTGSGGLRTMCTVMIRAVAGLQPA